MRDHNRLSCRSEKGTALAMIFRKSIGFASLSAQRCGPGLFERKSVRSTRCCRGGEADSQNYSQRFLRDGMYYIGLDVHKRTISYCVKGRGWSCASGRKDRVNAA